MVLLTLPKLSLFLALNSDSQSFPLIFAIPFKSKKRQPCRSDKIRIEREMKERSKEIGPNIKQRRLRVITLQDEILLLQYKKKY